MARLTSRELCRRVCLTSGAVTFHAVEMGRTGHQLREITEKLFRQYEAMAQTTECLYSETNQLFTWQYKTVRYSITDFKGL